MTVGASSLAAVLDARQGAAALFAGPSGPFARPVRAMCNSLRVVVAEDHVIVREGTRRILERDDALTIVGEAEDGAEAVRLAEELAPDIVLLDVALPVMNGIDATRHIRAGPGAPTVSS